MRNERDTGPAGRGESRNSQRGEGNFLRGGFKKGSPVGIWTFSIQKRLSGVDFGNDDGGILIPPLKFTPAAGAHSECNGPHQII